MSYSKEELEVLQGAVNAALNLKTRAEVSVEGAKAEVIESRRVLKEEFGVSTTEEVEAKIAEYTAELAKEVLTAKEMLAEASDSE